jgi:hypothetical protein
MIAAWDWRVIAHKFNIVDRPDNRVKTHKPRCLSGQDGRNGGFAGAVNKKIDFEAVSFAKQSV